ncbi:DUF2288 family protein [Pseudobacteriovorax antillogorgiicola]|uniref:DUF2288 domain-containing protein n=1 Tax=Pseudobacteriovorax antillogorgiicola TaxID=1513793 RepID=A0A1Y6BKR7_9BACT|nr:DUF2288 family protein [Pseudobacteriovorax antillogorgiicola]TCS55397.1 hypothetical protein EDD56_105118 [Pseudobacteriovorax antillogorgiicola]SMF13056.1 hypothetical protein SAMN06296036_105206 [Pseudobacteriovorax antillogorgiicola]
MSQTLEEKLSAEQDVLPWADLVRHFAFGRLFLVAPELDLTRAAAAIANDQASLIKTWMDQGLFLTPSATQVESWQDAQTQFLVNIVSPFVVVQEQPCCN